MGKYEFQCKPYKIFKYNIIGFERINPLMFVVEKFRGVSNVSLQNAPVWPEAEMMRN